MNFLLDQGIPRSTVGYLNDIGYHTKHVGELGLATALDKDIIDRALMDDSIVVTLDSDFHSLLAINRLSKPSVIRVRIEGQKGMDIARIIGEVIKVAKSELKEGAAVSVTSSTIRIRLLPLI